MKNILIVSPDILPVPAVRGGAVETIIEQLVSSNERLEDSDLKFTVISIKDSLIEISKQNENSNFIYFRNGKVIRKLSSIIGVFTSLLGKSKSLGNLYLRQICQHLKFNEYDYIVIENKPEYGLIISNYTNAKIILHLHNDRLDIDTPNADEIVNSYHSIFTVSEYVKSKVMTIPNARNINVKPLYNCVDTKKYSDVIARKSAVRSEIREKYELKPDTKILTYVGRLDSTKGVLELIEAFNRIKKTNIALIIVGASWFSESKKSMFVERLEREISSSTNPVIFTGYVKHESVPIYQVASDILIVPSVSIDACPLVVLESLASSSVLVSTDSGGIPELIPSDCGIVVERGEGGSHLVEALEIELSKLLEDPKLSEELSTNALLHVKAFDIDNYANEFRLLLDDDFDF